MSKEIVVHRLSKINRNTIHFHFVPTRDINLGANDGVRVGKIGADYIHTGIADISNMALNKYKPSDASGNLTIFYSMVPSKTDAGQVIFNSGEKGMLEFALFRGRPNEVELGERIQLGPPKKKPLIFLDKI